MTYLGYLINSPTTPEERKEIEQYNQSSGQESFSNSEIHPDYKSGADVFSAQNQTLSDSVENNYWANPANIVKQYVYDQAHPNEDDETRLVPRNQIKVAYDYLSAANPGIDPNEWQWQANDQYLQRYVSKWQQPVSLIPPTEEQAVEQRIADLLPARPDYPVKQWKDMSLGAKVGYSVSPGAIATTDQPWYTKITQQAIPTVTSYLGGMALGGTATGIAGAAAAIAGSSVTLPAMAIAAGTGAVMAAGNIVQNALGVELPVFSHVNNFMNFFASETEKVWGAGEQYVHNREVAHAGEFILELGKLIVGADSKLGDWDEFNTRKTAAGAFYESSTTGLGDKVLDAVVGAFGGETTKEGQVYLYNRGLDGPHDVQGAYGVEAMNQYADAARAIKQIVNPQTGKRFTDAEIEERILGHATEMYGTTGLMDEQLNSTVFDPLNAMPFLLNRGQKLYGKITGNAALMEAADFGKGNPLIDALPIGAQQIAEGVANRLGFRGSTAGFFETLDMQKNILTFGTKISDMTPEMQKMIGIMPDGKIRELLPTDPQTRWERFREAFNLTPEAKVTTLGAHSADLINAVMSESTPETLLKNLADLVSDVEPSKDSPAYKLWGTPIQKTVAETLKSVIEQGKYQMDFDVYEITRGNREALNGIASDLGKQAKDVLSLIDKKPDVFKKLITDYATEHEGKIGGQLIFDDGQNMVDQLKVFTGKDAQAWNDQMLKYETSLKIADELADRLVAKYGIKKDSTALRLSNLMKQGQGLLLLGMSPSYVANNLLNNIVTRAAYGVFGFMTIEQIDNFMTKNGMSPARYGDDASLLRGDSPNIDTTVGITERSIRREKRADDWIDKAGDAISSVKKFTLSTLGNKVEQNESKMAYGIGVQQYVNRMWKKGSGFREMDPALVQVIEAQSPGFTKMIYSSIGKHFNMDDIEKAIFASVVTPDARDVLSGIAKRIFPNDPTVISELFDKTGLTDTIKRNLEGAATRESIEAVIDRITKSMDVHDDRVMANEVANKSESVRNIAFAEGLPAVDDILSDDSIRFHDFWRRQREDWENTYKSKLKNNLKNDEWRLVSRATAARQEQMWKQQFQLRLQTMDGILRGLGFEDDYAKDYIRIMMRGEEERTLFYRQNSTDLDTAYREMNLYYEKYGDGRLDQSELADRIRTIWDRYYQASEDAYQKYYEQSKLLRVERNEVYVTAYEHATGADGTKLRELFDKAETIRDQMYERQKEIHSQTRILKQDTSLKWEDRWNRINSLYETFSPAYNEMIEKLKGIQGEIARESNQDGYIARAENGSAQVHAKKRVPIQDQIKSILDAENLVTSAEAGRTEAADRCARYLYRDEIRQGFVDAGQNPEMVDFVMALYDSRAKRWEADNPGKDFYQEGLKLKWITKNVEVENGLFQTAPAVESEAFKNWFRGSKVVTPEGKPLIAYHGSPNNFEQFDYKNLGKNGSVHGYGFYFTDDFDIASRYKGDSGKVYETYIRIEQPLSIDQITINKAALKKLIRGIDQNEITAVDEPGHWFLSNYADVDSYGVNKAVEAAANALLKYNDSDVELISDIIYTSGKEAELVYRIVKSELGYDGIITKSDLDNQGQSSNIYIPFLPEQIKSINNRGSFDPDNPNMLFQTAASIDTPEFKRWFKDSKAVDDNGQPLVLHHGSREAFDTFEMKSKGENTGFESAKQGIYFIKDEEVAASYARNGRVVSSTPELDFLKKRADELFDLVKVDNSYEPEFVKLKKEYDSKKAAYDDSIIAQNKEGAVAKVYLSIQNPYIFDYDGKHFDDATHTRILEYAQKNGFDSVIFKNLYDGGDEIGNSILTDEYVIFDPTRAKKIDNRGSWDPENPNMLWRNKKGAFEVIDGEAAIRLFNLSDVSTIVHESAHGFRRTLNDDLLADYAKWAGYQSLDEYKSLESRFYTDSKLLTDSERQRFIKTEEDFAVGFETYLIKGEAPTPTLQLIFHELKNFLLDIYQSIVSVAKPDDDGVLSIDGKRIDIEAEVNGVKLRDIFDEMLREPELNIENLNENSIPNHFDAKPDLDLDLLQKQYDEGYFIPIANSDKLHVSGFNPGIIGTAMGRFADLLSRGLTEDKKEYALKYALYEIDRAYNEDARLPKIPKDVLKIIQENMSVNSVEFEDIITALRIENNINDRFSIPREGIYLRRARDDAYGLSNIAGEVFADGKLVAVRQFGIYDQPIRLANGEMIRLLGLDPENHRGYVFYNETTGSIGTADLTKVRGLEDVPKSDADSLFNRGTAVGVTPDIEPSGSANAEIRDTYYKPILEQFLDEYEKAAQGYRGKNANALDLNTKAAIHRYLDEVVRQDLTSEKFNAMKYGEFKRDQALLNYSRQYGIDTFLTAISPYQFWYTRSVANWAKRVIEKPQWLRAAAKYKELADRNRHENYAYRLNELFQIPMPGLPEWMGGSVFIDPMNQIFPFLQFFKPIEDMLSDQNTLNKKTMTILNGMFENDEITESEMNAAIKNKSGDLWNTAMAQAKLDEDKNPGLTSLAQQYLQLPLYASWAIKHLKGKDDELSSFPITRFGTNVDNLTEGIPILGDVGNVAGAILTAPEKGLRKALGIGYNEFGTYGEYSINKQISQMCADGFISVNDALNAMNERSGWIYEEAVKRQKEENLLKMQGGLPAYQMKRFISGEGSIGGVLSSLALSPFSAKIFPQGEQTLRQMNLDKAEAYKAKANGDPTALQEFYKKNPEIVTRSATFYDDPEKLLRFTLYKQITNLYYQLDPANQQAANNAFGIDFQRSILNKETRNYESVDLNKLAYWANQLTGNIPEVPETEAARSIPNQVGWYGDPVVTAYQEYLAERENKYKDGYEASNALWQLPKELRGQFRALHPEAQAYIDWNRTIKEANPYLRIFFDERNEYMNNQLMENVYQDMPDSVIRDIEHWAKTGKQLRSSSQLVLKNLYLQYANPNFMDFDEFLRELKAYQ